MKTSNSTLKALSALLGVAFMLLIVLAGCQQTGGGGENNPTPTPTPSGSYAVIFGVEGANGTLKAKVDGSEITSGGTVAQDKTVVFTATPSTNYRVKGWTLDGKAVNGTNNSYSFPVTKAVTVKVSFEDASTPKPKHKITFSVEGGNGTLKAKVGGEEINSGENIEEGKEITFTAMPNEGYKVKEWKAGTACSLQRLTKATSIRATT